MKKLFVLMSMMFCIIGSAMAQKNIQAIGVHLNYGTKIESFSLGAKYQQNLTNEIRLEPSKRKALTCSTSTLTFTTFFQWQATSASTH